MKQGIIVEQSDIKKILAEHFGVSEDAVMQSKYSYIVMAGETIPAKDGKEEGK